MCDAELTLWKGLYADLLARGMERFSYKLEEMKDKSQSVCLEL
jgi:hypothetical protein